MLAIMLVLSSIGMAVARDQPVPVGMMEICAGGMMRLVPMDAQGAPTGPAHLCIDCAHSLFASVGQVAPAPDYDPVLLMIELWARARVLHETKAPAPQARGPPLTV